MTHSYNGCGDCTEAIETPADFEPAGVFLCSCIVKQGEVSYYACQAELENLFSVPNMSQEGGNTTGNFKNSNSKHSCKSQQKADSQYFQLRDSTIYTGSSNF
jgi:hypothetical protein